jgi:hypothetical protein
MHCGPQHQIGARIANSFLSTSSAFCEYSAAANHQRKRRQMHEDAFQHEAQRLIALFSLGALVPLDVAKRMRGNESSSSIYAAMARGDLDARKLGGKTVVTAESLIRSVILARAAIITTALPCKDDLSPEQQERLANTTPHGAAMRVKRRGRPIGSKTRPAGIEDSRIFA